MLNNGNYSDHIISALGSVAGTRLVSAERLSGNRIRIRLDVSGHLLDFRIFAFAVGSGGRSIKEERRVEITSTYASSLVKLGGVVDVVLGVERKTGYLVGIDPRRLEHGGPTHNASTFVYSRHFQRLTHENFVAFENDRQQLFSREYQIYFKPQFLLSYLSEFSVLHGSGLRQTPVVKIDEALIDRIPGFEASGSQTTLTYEQQVELALKRMQIGRLGEGLVYEREMQSLKAKGVPTIAEKVKWISQTKPYVGYDIGSYFESGDNHYIEVKSSIGNVVKFHLSENERKVALSKGAAYSIICVSNVFGKPSFRSFNDIGRQFEEGRLLVEPESFVVKIV
jgi:hypothetical protein